MKSATCASMMLIISPMLRMPIPSSTIFCVRKGVTSESNKPKSTMKDVKAICHLKGQTYFFEKRTKLCFSLTD